MFERSPISSTLNNSSSLEVLNAIVQRVTFHSEETGWSVLKVSPFNQVSEQVTVTVHQAKVFAGASIKFEGNWSTHAKFGRQFKATKITEKKPASVAALEKYLGSGLIFGVGPKTAKKIVKTFGAETLDVFENKIERLIEVEGIAKTKLLSIKKSWVEHREIRNVMMFLQTYGISTLYAVKIYKMYANKAIEILKQDPYRLAKEIYGIGFFSADKIALSLGLKSDDPKRVKAAINHVLAASRDEGHCFLMLQQIEDAVNEVLSGAFNTFIKPLLSEMQQAREIQQRLDFVNDSPCYYSNTLFYDEKYTAEAIKKRCQKLDGIDTNRLLKWLDQFNQTQKFPLSQQQQQAVSKIVVQQFSILTGGPGCGKTTTTKAIVKLLLAMKKKVLLAAPTGRAAQRMSEVIGIEAQTIHRLLVWDPHHAGFKKNEEDTLDCDFLILDECSMLDISLTAAILKALPAQSQILLIGDADQIPSVGAGSVLNDCISSQIVPVLALTEVFRQAKASQIIKIAHQINRGITPSINSPFKEPQIWQDGSDAQFIDAEEATQSEIKFMQKIKHIKKLNQADGQKLIVLDKNKSVSKISNINNEDCFESDLSNEDIQKIKNGNLQSYLFKIPNKFHHVSIPQLLKSESMSAELQVILGDIDQYSCLRFGLSASEMMIKLYSSIIKKYYGQHTEIQILSPMSRGSLGTNKLNRNIQAQCNPSIADRPQIVLGDRIFRIGDRVIQKRNNYDLLVFNGDIGKIIAVNNSTLELVVAFKNLKQTKEVIYKKENLIELDLAYAITIHKSQGSEFEVVIIPIVFQHYKMLYRNLIYTAITRAKSLVILIGTKKAFSLAVKNIDNRQRQTMLRELLMGTDR